MIRSLLRCIRLGMKAEKIVLAYGAWGYGEEEALARWRRDLAEVAIQGGAVVKGVRREEQCGN